MERLRITSTQLQAGGEEVRATCIELLCAAMGKIDSELERDILMWRIGLRQFSVDSADIYGYDEGRVQMFVDQALGKLIIGTPGEVFRAWDHVRDVFRSAFKTSLGALDSVLVFRVIQMAMPQADLAVAAILLAHLCGHAHAIDVIHKQVKHLACQQQRRLEEQHKKEQESQQRRSRIGELVDRIDWPDQPAPSDRPACVPQRLPRGSGRSVSGQCKSAKLGRYVGYESRAELNFIQFLEASDLVEKYCEQPVAIEYVLYGRTRLYYPDFLVDLRDGRRFAVEVKASLEEFAKYINMVKLAAVREYCHRQGWGLLATDNLHTLADLIARAVPEPSVTALRARLGDGLMSLASFKDFLNKYRLSWAEAAAVIYREGWCWRAEPFRLSIALPGSKS